MPKIRVNDIELNVVDRGAGPTVLFVHGFPLNHTMWNAQLDGLAHSFRVIAPDLRGFGDSDVVEGTVSMEQFADDLNALIDTLGIDGPISLCGLSMGGYVAFQFVRKYSDRLKSLILCDTRALADTPDAASARLKTAEAVLAHGPYRIFQAMQPKLFAESTPITQPEIVDRVRAMILNTHPAGIAAALRGMAERPDSSPILSGIDVPTLVIVGAEDAISPPEELRQLAAAIPQAKYAEIADAGHMSPMENPTAFNTALQEFVNVQR
jgi:pimeloyl-ACP methyl ester carboxylesterase